MSQYDEHLGMNEANYQPLSPISFMYRTAKAFPNAQAVAYGDVCYDYATALERVAKLAGALIGVGVGRNDTVSFFLPNIPQMFEAHYGVPMSGGVLNAINTRLDAATVAFILNHAVSKVLVFDSALGSVVDEAMSMVDHEVLLIQVVDLVADQKPHGDVLEYEAFLASSPEQVELRPCLDEWDAIALNYTSGTTGNPKGVVYHHRGAYLNAIGNIVTWDLPKHPRYLWTLPMFHCNGWCFPWTITERAGVHVCLRQITGQDIMDRIAEEQVSHMCGAPIIMQMMLDAVSGGLSRHDHEVAMMTAAAPPPATVLGSMKKAGFAITHVYGLTEIYGPAVVCEWQEAWNKLSLNEQAEKMARQGINYSVQEDIAVMNPENMTKVPMDGTTMGEVMLRGNITMKGYLKNPKATDEAFAGGWFHTGDLGVWHPDGYVQLKDRSKDIIISGGENISSIEVEDVIYKHPDVAGVAVVAKPDEKWGETPCAFIELRPGATVAEEEMKEFCRTHLAHYKCPRHFEFSSLPKTSTGKIQKFVLRNQLRGES